MLATRNTVRLHRPVDVSSPLEGLKRWAKRNVTQDKVTEASLALFTAVSLYYLGSRTYVGLQNYLMYAY